MRNLMTAVAFAVALTACATKIVTKPEVTSQSEAFEARAANSDIAYGQGPRIQPIYPGFDALYGIQGTTVLIALVMPGGEVANIRVSKSAGNRELDLAALNAVRQWRFIPERKNGVEVPGYARIPVNFNFDENSRKVPKSWPANYLHPHYVMDSQPFPYASVDDARLAVSTASFGAIAVNPGRKSQSFIIRDNTGSIHEWWIFTDMDTEYATALRYVFTSNGMPEAPEVKVSVFCKNGASVCDTRTPWLSIGPLFARGQQLGAEDSH